MKNKTKPVAIFIVAAYQVYEQSLMDSYEFCSQALLFTRCKHFHFGESDGSLVAS
jgi:hypothetical protein